MTARNASLAMFSTDRRRKAHIVWKSTKILLATALAAIGCLIVAGCGSSGSGGSGNSSTNGGGGTSTGRSLVELDTSVAPSLDMDGTAAADLGFEEAFLNMADTLVTWPTTEQNGVLVPNYKAGPSQLAPDLATSYSHHGLTWTFNLRHGVRSCFGHELTSADVVYSFRRAISVSGATATADFVAHVGGIFSGAELAPKAPASAKKLNGQVTASNKYTVQIKLLHPDELFPKIMTTWLMAPFDSVEMKKHATASDPWSHTYTNATNAPMYGPYCLKSWQKGSQMTFAANKGYWRGKPAFTNVTVRQVPADAQRVAALTSNQADIATGLTPAEYKRLGSVATVLKWPNNANNFMLGINYKYPPFNNLQKGQLIRQAIAYAIPYQQINQDVFYGQMTQMRGFAPQNSYGFTPIDRYSTNISKAKQLLAQAGYPNGKGLPAGSPAFQLSYAAERSATLQPMANLIRTSLNSIGIPVKLNPVTSAQEETSEATTHNLGMWIRDNSRALIPDVGYSALLYLASAKAGGLVASTNYDSPTMDSLYKQSSVQTGQARLATLKKIQELAMTDLPLVPIGSQESQLAVRKGLSGWLGNTYDLVMWQYLKNAG